MIHYVINYYSFYRSYHFFKKYFRLYFEKKTLEGVFFLLRCDIVINKHLLNYFASKMILLNILVNVAICLLRYCFTHYCNFPKWHVSIYDKSNFLVLHNFANMLFWHQSKLSRKDMYCLVFSIYFWLCKKWCDGNHQSIFLKIW